MAIRHFVASQRRVEAASRRLGASTREIDDSKGRLVTSKRGIEVSIRDGEAPTSGFETAIASFAGTMTAIGGSVFGTEGTKEAVVDQVTMFWLARWLKDIIFMVIIVNSPSRLLSGTAMQPTPLHLL